MRYSFNLTETQKAAYSLDNDGSIAAAPATVGFLKINIFI